MKGLHHRHQRDPPAAYLRIFAELLVAQLRQVAEQWADGATNNYRAEFLAIDPDIALGRILKGLGSFSGPELSGERLSGSSWVRSSQEDCRTP